MIDIEERRRRAEAVYRQGPACTGRCDRAEVVYRQGGAVCAQGRSAQGVQNITAQLRDYRCVGPTEGAITIIMNNPSIIYMQQQSLELPLPTIFHIHKFVIQYKKTNTQHNKSLRI